MHQQRSGNAPLGCMWQKAGLAEPCPNAPKRRTRCSAGRLQCLTLFSAHTRSAAQTDPLATSKQWTLHLVSYPSSVTRPPAVGWGRRTMCVCVRLCVCVNSCALRTSQALISFVSVISQPSSMLLTDNRICMTAIHKEDSEGIKREWWFQKSMFCPWRFAFQRRAFPRSWIRFWTMSTHSPCMHVM